MATSNAVDETEVADDVADESTATDEATSETTVADETPGESAETLTATVVGGSGFTGGELLRLISAHPRLKVAQATSRSYAGRSVGAVHPNLHGLDIRFSEPADLEAVDVLFAATPHGVTMEHIDEFEAAADLVVDLSADFRLDTAAEYDAWYDGHSAPEKLADAEYGLVEVNRENLAALDGEGIVASSGCNATATILGLKPLADAGLLADATVVVDVKVGSSEGGAGGGEAASHAERSGVVRPYAPTGHRHEAEIEQWLDTSVSFTCHAVDMVRGASATGHVFPGVAGDTGATGTTGDAAGEVTKADLWQAYRGAYEDEPFVQLKAGGSGVYRYPEPKAVAGTNNAQVGFELDEKNGRVVVFAAIDNMMKGSAGQAVHAANVALGFDETAGLDFQGLHPVGSP